MENNMQNFRSAFHGFNRDDVVHYLETLTAQHNIRVNQLEDDLKRKDNELDALRAQSREAADQAASAAEENGELTARVEELTAALETATSPAVQQELDALRAEKEALEARVQELEAQIAEREADTDWGTEELNAYRRAESVERQTRTRAALLRDEANRMVSGLAARMEQDRVGIDDAAEAMGKALEKLQAALDSSYTTLTDGTAALNGMKLELPEE